MNKRELADHVDVSVNTISRWVSLGCPYDMDEKGRYIFDPEDVESWRDRNISPQHDSDRQTPQQVASWGLNFAEKLMYYVEKCKHCQAKIMQDAKRGRFGGKR